MRKQHWPSKIREAQFDILKKLENGECMEDVFSFIRQKYERLERQYWMEQRHNHGRHPPWKVVGETFSETMEEVQWKEQKE